MHRFFLCSSRYRVWLLACIVSGCLWGQHTIADASALKFVSETGTFQKGNKSIIIEDGWIRIITGNRQWTNGFHYFNTNYSAFITPKKLLNKQTVADAQKQQITFTARVPLDKTGKTATIILTARALKNGELAIHTQLNFASQEDRMLCKTNAVLLKIPLQMLQGAVVRADQWQHKITSDSDNQTQSGILAKHKLKEVEMFVGQPNRSFLVSVTKGQLVYREYHIKQREPYAEIAIHPTPDGQTAFVIKLPTDLQSVPSPVSTSTTKPSNINFFKYEGMVTPDYSLSRNLIQNPSFEAGFHNWWPGRLSFTDLQNDDFISIDSTQAYQGKSSLHGVIHKGQYVFSAYHMAVPTQPGRLYTFSFYAKADRPGVKTGVLGITSQWGQWALQERLELTTKWKRYNFSFTASHRIVSIGLGERWWDPSSSQIDGANIWIDCVQLEQGPLTDYTEKPFQAQLVTNQFGHTYEAQNPKRATLKVHNVSDQPREVDVQIQVRDFFDKVCETRQFKLDIPADSLVRYPMDFSNVMGTGLYTLAVQMQSPTFTDTDYFRMAVIKPLKNTHRHKNIFAIKFQGKYGWKKRFDYLKRIGIGSVISGYGFRIQDTKNGVQRTRMGAQGPYPQPFMYELANKNRILTFANIFYDNHMAGDLDLRQPEAYTEEALLGIEQYCADKAKQYPRVMYWELINEPDAIGIPDQIDGVNMAKVVRAMRAARRGIRKGNPNAKVSSPDPFNMYAAGRSWLQRYLQAGGADTFDIAAIHTYRPTPEVPDLDSDTQSLIQMLDEQGYTGDIWWTEGMLWYPYTVPELNTTVYKGNSASHAFFGALTYDIGRSEKIAAAFVARHYLVALKYHKRVKMDLDWGTSRYFIDWNQTPRAFIYAANTLGNLLGNATYSQDVDVVPDTHIYVFEDEYNRPVAAMWNYASDVNHFDVQPPIAQFYFAPGEVQAIDFMMNPIDQSNVGPVKIVLGPYPTFLIGKPDSLGSFIHTLKQMDVGGKDFSPLRVTTRMQGTQATLTVANILSRPISGTAQIQLDGQPLETHSLAFTGKDTKKLMVDLSQFAKPGSITPIPLMLRFTTQDGKGTDFDQRLRLGLCPKRKAPIKIDGKLDDWEQVPGIVMDANNLIQFNKKTKPYADPSDFSAILRTTWDDNGLYLSVRVKDNIHMPFNDKGPAFWWKGDSLQVYFDTWADGRDKTTGDSMDNNDYVYNFSQQASPSGNIYRSYVPEWQVAFLKTGFVSEVQAVIRREGHDTIYEIFFPKRQIMPLKLKIGTAFGFAILVNDRDDADAGRIQGLTLTPAGTQPHMNPRLYPLWLLTD